MAFVEFKDVRKIYTMGEVQVAAVDGMSFEIEQGELVVVVGPSGSGKTTLLNMMGGMDSCTSGSITLDGARVDQFNEKQLTDYRRYDIGFVFQFYNLVQNLTALENVELASQICRNPLPPADVLTQVGLAHRMDNFPAQLSGGEQQRVALARVLVLRPQLILMDEPLSNLDAKLRLHMRTEIRRIQQELKLPCLYVTHDQKEALTMSDRIMVMNKGKIEQIGTPMHLYDDPATPFVADFIGQANLLYGTLVSVEDKYGIVDVAGRKVKARMGVLNPPKVGGKALLIVRPENLNIGASDNCLAVKLINRLFEGDRVDYQFEVVNGFNPKPYSMSVPFLPGTTLLPEGSTLDASFVPNAGVLLNGE